MWGAAEGIGWSSRTRQAVWNRRMVEAQHCLNKARFFSENAASVETQNRTQFLYFFESAVVWARSVTLLLQKQYVDCPSFAVWYESRRQMLEADPLARFLVVQRNYVLKQGGASVRKVVTATAHVTVGISVTVSAKVIRGSWKSGMRYLRQDSLDGIEQGIRRMKRRLHRTRPAKPKREREAAMTVDRMRFAEQPWNNEPALVLLDKHLDVLQGIVDDVVRRFGDAH